MSEPKIYGIATAFEDPNGLVNAARVLHEHGFRRMEAYTPYPVHQLEHYIAPGPRLPPIVLAGGLLGSITAWTMQYYIAVIDYPTNVGGRPLNSWPSFIVIMFELTILFAGLAAFFGLIALCGFPWPHHPMFEIPRFTQASNNLFFLCIESRDPQFDADGIKDLLRNLDPLEVVEVEAA